MDTTIQYLNFLKHLKECQTREDFEFLALLLRSKEGTCLSARERARVNHFMRKRYCELFLLKRRHHV